MKRIFFACFIIGITSFKFSDVFTFDAKTVSKEFTKVKSDLYVCKYEVSNLEYRNFLADLANTNQTELYKDCLPDTSTWKKELANNAPYVQYYFRYPNFNGYPVVGISYGAAKEYCNWLSKKYNEDPKRKFDEVAFKLLSKEEWIYAANKGDKSKDFTWGSGFMQNNRKQWLCNFKHQIFVFDSTAKKYIEVPLHDNSGVRGTPIAGPVKEFYPNSFGLYNMCGNAAEMIEEKGIAKGGSYNDPAYGVRIASERKYVQPQSDIGFRVAMKVVKE